MDSSDETEEENDNKIELSQTQLDTLMATLSMSEDMIRASYGKSIDSFTTFSKSSNYYCAITI
jgi:hypothetical protein